MGPTIGAGDLLHGVSTYSEVDTWPSQGWLVTLSARPLQTASSQREREVCCTRSLLPKGKAKSSK